MKHYDLIVIGTGSAMNLVNPYLEQHPGAKIAVIDKDEPGGICLNKGCIPTKMLLYPADLVRQIENGRRFGIDVNIEKIHFRSIMERMRAHVFRDMNNIRESFRGTELLDFYEEPAAFTAPYTLKAGRTKMKGRQIFLCTGSRPFVPDIPGLEKAGYLTSDTVLELNELPRRLVIIGGGYIAAEYAHFFSALGTEVTVLGRNPRFLKEEEPEISEIAAGELGNYVKIYTGTKVRRVEAEKNGTKAVTAGDGGSGTAEMTVETDAILVAAGRASNSDILNPESGGIDTDKKGWIKVNEYLETSRPGVWAFGDATGKHLFKHAANYEAEVVYQNAVRSGDGAAAAVSSKTPADYHAVPHAVFTYPEIAAAGMGESEAVEAFGEENVIIGAAPYGETGKGAAMGLEESDYFVKVLLKNGTGEILGAHIVGPQASVLIQEIVTCMYTGDRRYPFSAMHIHPALSEVVDRAFSNLMTVHAYGHYIGRIEDDHDHHDHHEGH
jgi:mycothione reductase